MCDEPIYMNKRTNKPGYGKEYRAVYIQNCKQTSEESNQTFILNISLSIPKKGTNTLCLDRQCYDIPNGLPIRELMSFIEALCALSCAVETKLVLTDIHTLFECFMYKPPEVLKDYFTSAQYCVLGRSVEMSKRYIFRNKVYPYLSMDLPLAKYCLMCIFKGNPSDIISIHRLFEIKSGPISYDIGNIINPATGLDKDTLYGVSRYIRKMDFTSKNINIEETLNNNSGYLSGKRSPNDKPATASYAEDYQGLSPEMVNVLEQIAKLKGEPGSIASLKYMRDNYESNLPNYNEGRLAYLKDKFGKTRIVAIANSWVQQALQPFNKILLDILGEIPEDLSSRQDDIPVVMRLQSEKRKVGLPFTSDCTAWTDRLPSYLNKVLLQCIFGQQLGRLVYKATKRMRFKTSNCEIKVVRYEVGTPMGCLVSWASSALVHHAIVRYCYTVVGKDYTSDYMILGDDVAIGDSEAYRLYTKVILKLGIRISQNKCTASRRYCEFAKRLFLSESQIVYDVTGFPATLLSHTNSGIYDTSIMFIITMRSRGYSFKQGLDIMLRIIILNYLHHFRGDVHTEMRQLIQTLVVLVLIKVFRENSAKRFQPLSLLGDAVVYKVDGQDEQSVVITLNYFSVVRSFVIYAITNTYSSMIKDASSLEQLSMYQNIGIDDLAQDQNFNPFLYYGIKSNLINHLRTMRSFPLIDIGGNEASLEIDLQRIIGSGLLFTDLEARMEGLKSVVKVVKSKRNIRSLRTVLVISLFKEFLKSNLKRTDDTPVTTTSNNPYILIHEYSKELNAALGVPFWQVISEVKELNLLRLRFDCDSQNGDSTMPNSSVAPVEET